MLTAERLRELLDYNAETGVFRWRIQNCKRILAGSEAGYMCTDRRIQIRIDYRLYKAHRLVWLYVHGRWPRNQIDHIDGDPANNRLSNLREANNQQNLYNQRLKRSNTSGYKGVCYVASRGRFHANIRINGKSKFLGSFSSAEEAHEAYKAAAQKHHGEFACAG